MNKKGFTLIEVLTVVVIVSILTAVALPRYSKFTKRARFTKAQVMVKAIYESCERLVAEYGYEDRGVLLAKIPSAGAIGRLDIGSDSLLPSGFSISSNTTITGAGFTYTLQNDSCNVRIDQDNDNSFYIIYTGDNMLCYNNEQMCDLYGVDMVGD